MPGQRFKVPGLLHLDCHRNQNEKFNSMDPVISCFDLLAASESARLILLTHCHLDLIAIVKHSEKGTHRVLISELNHCSGSLSKKFAESMDYFATPRLWTASKPLKMATMKAPNC